MEFIAISIQIKIIDLKKSIQKKKKKKNQLKISPQKK